MMRYAVPSRRRRVAVLAGALVTSVVTITFAWGYHRPDPPASPEAPGMTVGSDAVTLAMDAPAWSVIKLEPVAVAEPRWSEPIPARIAFDETRASRVGSPLAGRVTAIAVERGQHVKTGSALFVVASSSLAELRTDRERALAQRTTARANLERTRALVEAQSLPGKELVTANQQAVEADLAVKFADQKLATLQVTSADATSFTVTAPRDGVVVDKNLAVGQQIDASAAAAITIADLSVVWLVADVFESDVGGLVVGTPARCTIEGIERSSELDGVVDQVSAIVDPDRHTIPIRITLANPDGALRPNAYAQVRFFDPTSRVTLPASAVMSNHGQSYVFVNEHGALTRRNVSVGAERHGRVPILSQIGPQAQVVTRGAILLDNEIQLDN